MRTARRWPHRTQARGPIAIQLDADRARAQVAGRFGRHPEHHDEAVGPW